MAYEPHPRRKNWTGVGVSPSIVIGIAICALLYVKRWMNKPVAESRMTSLPAGEKVEIYNGPCSSDIVGLVKIKQELPGTPDSRRGHAVELEAYERHELQSRSQNHHGPERSSLDHTPQFRTLKQNAVPTIVLHSPDRQSPVLQAPNPQHPSPFSHPHLL